MGPAKRSRRIRTAAAAAVWLTALAVLPLEAQPVERPAFDEEVTVSEVVLDVVVTDRRGNVVVGLDRDDFRVLENGEPVEIREVEFYSHRELLEPEDEASRLGIDRDLRSRRNFILLFHVQRQLLPRLATRQLDAARRASRWVASLGSDDYVAVLGYQYGLRPQIDFSNDPAAVAAAIDRAIVPEETPPSRLGETPVGAPSLLAELPKGRDLIRASRVFEETLELLAEAAAGIPGRKNLVLFSIGFGEVDEFGYRPDPRYFPRLVQRLNDANVATYAIDLLPTGMGRSRRTDPFANALSHLAVETGGEYFFNFTSFAAPLAEIDQDTSGYYLLSYASRHPAGESGYQRVSISTLNPAFRIRGREGYLYGERAGGGG